MQQKKFITTKTLQELLGDCCLDTAKRRAQRLGLKPVRIGRAVLWNEQEVMAALESKMEVVRD